MSWFDSIIDYLEEYKRKQQHRITIRQIECITVFVKLTLILGAIGYLIYIVSVR